VDGELVSARAMNCSLDIIIVNWNAGDHLRDCLASIARTRTGPELRRVTVVDNASSDGSLYGLEDLSVPLEIIRNDKNVGFAAACNQGAATSTADYLLFLNPDTRLFPNTLETVAHFMESERAAGIGICGVQVVDSAGRPGISCAPFPTLRAFFGRMTGLHIVLPRLFPSYHHTPAELSQSRLVDQVIGAFYFVRRDLFTRLGGFDERYFLYFEEVDFAPRGGARGVNYGWRVFEGRRRETREPAPRAVAPVLTFFVPTLASLAGESSRGSDGHGGTDGASHQGRPPTKWNRHLRNCRRISKAAP